MQHDYELISDYVLGLLPGEEASIVAGHLAECDSCRQRALTERTLVEDIRSAINVASNFDRQDIQGLMPANHPTKKARALAFGTRQIALAAALSFIIVGGLILEISGRHGSWLNSDSYITTATSVATETPSPSATVATNEETIGGRSESSDILFLIPALAAPDPRMTLVSSDSDS